MSNGFFLLFIVSNEVPEVPVVAPTSGSVFEKRLIEKLLLENGNKDPINGEPLSASELIEIKSKQCSNSSHDFGEWRCRIPKKRKCNVNWSFLCVAASFVKAKPPNYTSIPGILKMLQDEWDAVMLNR